jgi:hypothetical protein
MCEDCGLRQPTYGVPGDTKKRRWCGPCSKQREGAGYLRKRPRAVVGQECGHTVVAAQSTPAMRRKQLGKMEAQLRTQQINVQDGATLAVVQARTNGIGVPIRDEVNRPASTRQTPSINGVVAVGSQKIESDEGGRIICS